MAFVTRAHRHLWGKNNEDPLALLFRSGLKNDFAKKMLLGWNKFGQHRPAENWGLSPQGPDHGKIYLRPGMVVPYIESKKLVSVFIQPFSGKARLLPGSLAPNMVMGDPDKPCLILSNLMDALFLFQETRAFCVVVHPDDTCVMDLHSLKQICRPHTPWVLVPKASSSPFSQEVLDDLQARFIPYSSQDDLLSKLLP